MLAHCTDHDEGRELRRLLAEVPQDPPAVVSQRGPIGSTIWLLTKNSFLVRCSCDRPGSQEPLSGDQVSGEFASSVSTGVECVERLFGLAPKSRFVAVQTFKCAAI